MKSANKNMQTPNPTSLVKTIPLQNCTKCISFDDNVSKAPKQFNRMNTEMSDTQNRRSCTRSTPQQFHADYGKTAA